jgi:tetratricopeptide (TPR) repeat protein
VQATLVAVPGGATQAQARVEGSADSLPQLADRLTVRLLAGVQSTREGEDLATLTGTSLPALRAYVAGRAAFRANRPAEAEDQFERSLFLDSTFVPAGLGLAAIENVWGPRRDFDERWKLDAVWRQRDRLSAADRALLVAYLGPRYPRPSTLAEMIASGEQATLTAPNRVEAWYITGVSLQRYGQLIGYTAWEARAKESLRHALALDSTHAPAADVLFMLAVGAGEHDAARRYAKLYLAHSPPPVSADFVRWRLAVALGDSAGLAAARRQFTEAPGSLNLMRVVMWSQEHGVGVDDGARAAEMNLRRAEGALARTIAVRRSVQMLLNLGRPGEASRLLATSERGLGMQGDVGAVEFRIYAALYWDGDKADAAVAARRLEAYLAGASASPLQIRDRNTASCALAHWRIAAADTGAARAALALRQHIAPAATSAFDATPVCVAAAEALLDPAVLERLDDRLRAVSTSRALLITVGNLIAARLYQARGDQRRALDIIRRRAGWAELLSTQLAEEGRLAALAGDRIGAIRAYRHYLVLRTAPEPELQQRVEQVRAEMQRLQRGLRP